MKYPLQIVFHGVDHSDAVEARVREKAQRLERYHDRILGCRVVIDTPHKHQKKGQHYSVRIDLTVPGSEIVISRDPKEHAAHEDVYVAVRDAFDAAGRALEDDARKHEGGAQRRSIRP